MQRSNQSSVLDITVISAQDLKKVSNFFPCRLRSFVSVSAAVPTTRDGNCEKIYRTGVDERGGRNPTWGAEFHMPLDQAFFHQRFAGVYLQLYTKHPVVSQRRLGWCLIPATDIVNVLAPVGSTRFLSYRLRNRDGSRGNGVINVAVTLRCSDKTLCPSRALVSNAQNYPSRALVSNAQNYPAVKRDNQTVLGIPVTFGTYQYEKH